MRVPKFSLHAIGYITDCIEVYIYNTKWWLSFRVIPITTPLLIGAANDHRPPLMLCHVWVVNSMVFLCVPYTILIDFDVFN